MRRFNWRPWGGLALCVVAFLTYFTVLVQFPVTRDVPWVPFLLFAVAVWLLISGWRRAAGKKIVATIVAVLGLTILGLFTYSVTAGSKSLPVSAGAPAVGEKAPEFTLPDTRNRPVSLASQLTGANGVLLVFYRGYWCPFCNSELRSLQERLPEFERAGVRVMAISVDPPAASADLAQRVGYTFPILSDQNAAVTRQYNLLHEGAGIEGAPVARPAEFLLDRTGTVRWRNLTEDYRVRARVEQILEQVQALR
jgi:peroxiredoxin